jgi:hypothetical protein
MTNMEQMTIESFVKLMLKNSISGREELYFSGSGISKPVDSLFKKIQTSVAGSDPDSPVFVPPGSVPLV